MQSKTNFLRCFSLTLVAFAAQVADFQTSACLADTVRFNTNVGSFDVDLFEDTTPQTVMNFLFYLNRGDYVGSFIHRSDPGFVVQGGGFYPDGSPIATVAPVINEPGHSNLRGTIAMAKLAGDPNSATSQWFFNLSDNVGLDTNNGGFTVFGEVLGNGMDIVDQIAGLDIVDGSGGNPSSPFGEIPVLDGSVTPFTFTNNVVVVQSIVAIPEPSGISFLLLTSALLLSRRRRI